ncbi:ABC transporter ATP-binding protein [Hoylesella shahii]
MILVRNLSKSFWRNSVLEDINYTFSAGKIYGIMGENGAGKSTLFKCIMGLESYNGEVIKPKPLRVGYLNDTPFFYSFVTGMEYITFCLKARNLQINKQEINKLNEKFALPLEKYATSYSLGMKKRLMILGLMLQNNDLVIMDEPFNGLDLAGSIILKQWINRMKKEGKCVILSSHIISVLTEICDDISYIHNGKVVANYSGKSAGEIEQSISKLYFNIEKDMDLP